ncbi:MAG: endo-1,4-beta-xylanase, partial [Lachnospiraceae bacterium]|nr:endo-1,4-beta-xylanase [Lachnospiraceae bacterium]
IGMQGHYSTTTSLDNVRKSLDMFRKIDGIKVSVSELDVQINGISKGKYDGEQEMTQAIFYARLFNIYKENADLIERVTFWGYKDNTSWRAESAPLLFDANLNPKEAYYAVLNTDAYAALGPQEIKLTTKKLEAAKGTPVIDGEVDDCWSSATAYEINIPIMAWQGASGTVKYMWDENNFYALFDVKDGVLNKDNSNTYEQDSIELFLDPNNCKDSTYDKLCGQYRCNYESSLSYGTVPSRDGVTAQAVKTGTGYRVEIAVPMLIEAKAGVVMGVDGHINDANDKGARISVMKLNATQDSDYTNPSAWAEITLK